MIVWLSLGPQFLNFLLHISNYIEINGAPPSDFHDSLFILSARCLSWLSVSLSITLLWFRIPAVVAVCVYLVFVSLLWVLHFLSVKYDVMKLKRSLTVGML